MDKEYFLDRLLLKIMIAFSLGITAGRYVPQFRFVILFAIMSFFLALFCHYFAKSSFKRVALYLAVILLGYLWFLMHQPNINILEQYENKRITVVGEAIDIKPRSSVLILQIDNVNTKNIEKDLKIAVVIKNEMGNPFHWGDRITFSGLLVKPQVRTNPGGFSEKEYLNLQGVAYKLIPYKMSLIENAGGWKALINQVRQKIGDVLQSSLPSIEAGIAVGLLLGDKSQIDAEFYDNAQKLGIAHLFAVSGLHVGFLLLCYFYLVRRVAFLKKAMLPGAIVLLVFYSFLTGLTPSVVRASIMAILALIAEKTIRHKDFLTILATGALVILVANPASLFLPGFQLSFVTVWGLVYLCPLVEDVLFFLPMRVKKLIAVPLAAQLAAFPIVLCHFNLFSFWAPLVNIIMVPVAAVLVPLLLAALSLAVLSMKFAEPLLLLSGGVIYAVVLVIEKITKILSRSYLYLASPSLVWSFFYYGFLISLKKITQVRLRLITAFGFLFLIICRFVPFPALGSLEITFVDVGQGDGAIIKTPLNKYIVIDGGPGQKTLAEVLKYKGVNRISLMILSHPDFDHINGLFEIIEDFVVENLLISSAIAENKTLQKLVNNAGNKEVSIVEGYRNLAIKFPSGVSFVVLSPKKGEVLENTNEASLVVNCSYKEQDVLFTGDIGAEVFEDLSKDVEDIEVIKIPHHGSKNSFSDKFYTRIRPESAIISAGRFNRYGHPHEEVLNGIAKYGGKIYRTDSDGAVTMVSDGKDYDIFSFLDNNEEY